MIYIALWLAGAFVLMQFLILVIVISRYLKMPLRISHLEQIRDEHSRHLAPVLDTVAPLLSERGFRYLCSVRSTPMLAVAGMPDIERDVYFHDGLGINATVELSDFPTPIKLCEIFLWTSFADGEHLLTVDGYRHGLMPFPRSVRIGDAYRGDFDAHLAHHLRLRERRGQAYLAEPLSVEQARGQAANCLPCLEQEGVVYRRSDSADVALYGVGLRAACAMGWRLRCAALWIRKGRSLPSAFSAPVKALAERAAFVRTFCVLRGMSAPPWFRRTTFVLSGALFLGLGTWWWGASAAATLALVVALHEGGHWAAMKLAGFRDVHVFFVPGMGAVTSGEKHDAGPLVHMGVYLAGPMPGILLALAAMAWIASGAAPLDASWYPLLKAAIYGAFVVNALNLLPLLPLDGGRVVELLVVARLPWLRFVFSTASVVSFIALAYRTGEPFLGGFAAFLSYTAYYHYFAARAGSLWLRQKAGGGAQATDARDGAIQLHDFLAQPSFRRWPFQTKLLAAFLLLPRVHGRLPSWKEASGGLAVYVLCCLLPLIAFAAMMFRAPVALEAVFDVPKEWAQSAAAVPPPVQDKAAARAAWERDERHRHALRDAALAAAPDKAHRLKLLRDQVADATDAGEAGEAVRFARLLYEEVDAGNAYARADAALLLAGSLDETNPSPATAREVVSLRGEAERILRTRLANESDERDVLMLGELLADRAHQSVPEEELSLRGEVVRLYVARLPASDLRLAMAWQRLALALHRAGRWAKAEQHMRTMMAALPDDAASRRRTFKLRIDMAWMLIAYGRLAEAERFATRQFPLSQADAAGGRQFNPRAMLWTIALDQGNWSAAREHAAALVEVNPSATGHWWLDWLRPAQPGYMPMLMLIESERRLHRDAEAERLVAQMRKRHLVKGDHPGCRTRVVPGTWSTHHQQQLRETELRELRCAP